MGNISLKPPLESSGNNNCIDIIPYINETHIIKPNTIFVSIASYRDYECSDTLKSLFTHAKYPSRIFVGVCEQNKQGEYSEICSKTDEDIISMYMDNIRTITLPHTQAKGPTYARYHCSKLWRGEQYFLQIDSHTHFIKDWDSDLIGMIETLKKDGVKKPVLSAYPPSKDQMKVSGFPEMDNGKFTNDILIFLCGWSKPSSKPILARKPWVAAGLMFMESKFLSQVPFDPYLSHVFMGEELLFSARLWTNGWDIYAPNKKVLYHHYNRKGLPMYHSDISESYVCRKNAEKRIFYILGLIDKHAINKEYLTDVDYYSLGKVRSINDFWEFAKVNYKNKTIVKI